MDAHTTARDFVRKCLTIDPTQRMTAHQALQHPFLVEDVGAKEADLLPNVKKNFNARRTLHAAIDTIRAINKLREGQGQRAMDGAMSTDPPTQTPAEPQDRAQPAPGKGLWSAPGQN
jgi:calcium/calmodulin-dependent protein kinase I